MAISLVTGGALSGNSNNGNDVVINLPAGIAEGDYVFLCAGRVSGASVSTSGYNQIGSDATNGTHVVRVFRKKMGSSPDASVTVTGSANTADAMSVVLFVLRGVDLVTSEDATPTTANGSSTNPNCPSITTVTNNAWVLAFASSQVNDASVTTPTNYTNGTYANQTDTNPSTTGGATRSISTAGAEDPAAFTGWSTGSWGAITVAVRPYVNVNLTLTSDAGSFTETGQSAAQNVSRSSSASSYALTGQTASSQGIYALCGPWTLEDLDLFGNIDTLAISLDSDIWSSADTCIIGTSASISASGSVVAEASLNAGVTLFAQAAINASGLVSASAVNTKIASATITSTASVTASANKTIFGNAVVNANASVTASATKELNTVAIIDAAGLVSASGIIVKSVDASISASASLNASAQKELIAVATISANGSVVVSAINEKYANAVIQALASVVGSGVLNKFAVAQINASGEVVANAEYATKVFIAGDITASGQVSVSFVRTRTVLGNINSAGFVSVSVQKTMTTSGAITQNAVVYAKAKRVGEEWNLVTDVANQWTITTAGQNQWTTQQSEDNTWNIISPSSNTWQITANGNETWQ